MQCCGDPFVIGSDVSWSVWPVADSSWYAEFLDPETANSITDHEDHHPDEDAELGQVRGVVLLIDAVFCRYAVGRDGGATPIEGSGFLEPRTSADGWEAEDDLGVGRTFMAYLVNVESA